MTRPSTANLLRSKPFWPLAATLAVQTLAAMALYSLPAVAPEVARDLQVPGALAGSFVALTYGVGIMSALILLGLVRRYGGVRATQAELLAAAKSVAALLTGLSGPGWPTWAVMANALLTGCTAGGYTGVGYAEYATLGGSRRIEATGLGTAIFFAGGMAAPPIFGVAVTALGGFRGGYTVGSATRVRPRRPVAVADIQRPP